MDVFVNGVGILGKLVNAIGVIVKIWGGVNLMEGYGQENPSSKSQGVKQFVAGGGIILIGMKLIPMLATIFN